MTTATVVGLFRDVTEARAAVHSLERDGFRREDISLVAQPGETLSHEGDEASGTAKGAAIGGAAGILLGLTALAIPGIGPLVAMGPLAVALTGAGVGAATGGMFGALSDMGIPEHESKYYEHAVKQGGSILAVRAGVDTIERAQDILDRHGALDVHENAFAGDAEAGAEPNLGDEGGSTQWAHRALTADGPRSRARAYPDNRKAGF